MATYVLFGKYSTKAIQEISPERTEKAMALIKKAGGELKAGYALLGEHDLILIADLPGTEEAVKLSVGLARLLGISFTTAPAVSLEKFDKLAAKA